ncbi:DUF3213 domain-containing protein [Thermococcus sp.]
MLKIELRFGEINPVDAMVKQYELLKEEGIYRAFINGYSKRASVVFDESKISKEEVLKRLGEFKPKVVGVQRLSLEELVESSYSWNNHRGEVKV